MTKKSLFCIATSHEQAQGIVNELKSANFPNKNILAIPGSGPFAAAGPLVDALSGAGVGGIAGALIGMGVPEPEANLYEDKVQSGNILLSVYADNSDEIDRAKNIFENAGAENIISAEQDSDSRAEDQPARATDEHRRRQGSKPTRDDIARRAYEIYLEKGCPQGHENEHWQQASDEMAA